MTQNCFVAEVDNGRGIFDVKTKRILWEGKEAVIEYISDEKHKARKSEEALKNALVAAEHANKAKTTFLSNMSHDIRTR